MNKNIPSLDGWRAISISIVVIGHLGKYVPSLQWWDRYVVNAPFGVTVFFVISGFLITSLLLDERTTRGSISLKNFYIRRCLRIFPVYFLYLIFILAFTDVAAVYGWIPFLHALTFTTNFTTGGPVLLGHFWSLAVEEQFYLFWPWVVRRSKRLMTIVALTIIGSSPLFRILDHEIPWLSPYALAPFFKHTDALMVGALLARAAKDKPDFWEWDFWRSNTLRVGLLAVVWLINVLNGSLVKGSGVLCVPFGNTIQSLCIAYFLVSTIVVQNDRLFAFLNHRYTRHIGKLSYSIYIWQQFILQPPTAWWMMFPQNLCIVLLAAELSYHAWERPFLRRKREFA